jgi:uncharacterized protein YidB (DUF937 family)
MANLEDSTRSAVPGGNIGKPLMIAFIALLASGALFRGSSTGAAANAGSQPKSDEGSGGLLGGLGGLLQRLQKGGLGDAASSWVDNGQGRFTARSIKRSISTQVSFKTSSGAFVRAMSGASLASSRRPM